MSEKNVVLLAENLKKSYGTREILHGVSLRVEAGEFLSVMGESGSGKSTLLNLLAGNLRPDAGTVTLNGREVTAMTDRELARLRRTDLGFVYQSLNLIDTLTARDNILLPLVLDRADLNEGKKRMRAVTERMRVEHLLDAFPETLSGGERQRVAIARAMVHRPAILMLDEPTGSLDSRSATEVMELLRELNREEEVTILQVTHSTIAASYGDRTVFMRDGRVSDR